MITINKEDYVRAIKRFHAKKSVYVPGVGIDTSKFKEHYYASSSLPSIYREEIHIFYTLATHHGQILIDIRKFRSIYDSTMDKDNAEEYYYFEESFYKSMCNDLPQNVQIFCEFDHIVMITYKPMILKHRMESDKFRNDVVS